MCSFRRRDWKSPLDRGFYRRGFGSVSSSLDGCADNTRHDGSAVPGLRVGLWFWFVKLVLAVVHLLWFWSVEFFIRGWFSVG